MAPLSQECLFSYSGSSGFIPPLIGLEVMISSCQNTDGWLSGQLWNFLNNVLPHTDAFYSNQRKLPQ